MEKIERSTLSKEIIKRQETIDRFATRTFELKDPELAYCCIQLHGDALSAQQKSELVDVIANAKDPRADEMAFRLLRDQPELSPQLRDALFEYLVASGDKTTCSLTLQFVSNLGHWEARLLDVG